MYESGSRSCSVIASDGGAFTTEGRWAWVDAYGTGPFWLLVFCCSDEMDRLVREALQRIVLWALASVVPATALGSHALYLLRRLS
jgi:hypothetical protein